MSAWSNARELVADLAELKLPNVFNPYSDRCLDFDLADGPEIRFRNLEFLLEAALEQGAETLFVAQELGRKGGRRTGLPLTDELSLECLSNHWGGVAFERATKGPAMKEQTAFYVWQALEKQRGKVFMWNAFPLQPFSTASLKLNRGHTTAERRLACHFLPWIVRKLKPIRIIALGRVAETALSECGLNSRYVRHPGRGGGKEFLEATKIIFGTRS